MTYPVLTPAYGLGSYGRIGPALAISSPRTKIGSLNRIYSYMKPIGLAYQFEQYVILALGLKYLPKVNPWTGI